MNAKPAWLLLLLLVTFGLLHAEEKVHVLRSGETLYSLARTYRVSLDTLLSYNEINDATALPIGSRIRIPSTYVVREGEYVFSIARELGVNWQDLLRANGLDNDDVVRPGDVLILPGSRVATGPQPDAERGAPNIGPDEEDREAEDDRASEFPAVRRHTDLWPHPGSRATWEGRFPGVVMEGRSGDEIRSVTAGVVSFAGPFTSFGKIVLVRGEGGGYIYGYAGAESLNVQAGDRVEVGSLLGAVGYSPAFDSIKVLFTVWYRNRYIDPERAPRG
jgi:LysM repeat protein